MTLQEFRNKIVIKDAGGNRTYLTVTINGYKYGQSYSNTVNTIEEMINAFMAFYFPLAVEDKLSIDQLA